MTGVDGWTAALAAALLGGLLVSAGFLFGLGLALAWRMVWG